MQEWINQVLQSPSFDIAVLPASFLLGVLGALNPCCTAPLLGAVAGYSGSLSQRGGRRAIVLAGIFFMLGTVVALAIVGAATGFVSQLAGNSLGSYWKMFAGFVLIFFGLACLKLVPIKLPKLSSPDKNQPAGLIRGDGVRAAGWRIDHALLGRVQSDPRSDPRRCDSARARPSRRTRS